MVATWRTRFQSRLFSVPPRPDPTVDEIAQPGAWFLGGEPTLRADLPALLAASPGSGLVTDGLALQSPAALRMLRDRGLAALRVQLHSARPDAHDWLMGRAGTAKGAMRAIRAGCAAGLDVEVHAVVTRPTQRHLPELLELAERLGVRAVLASVPTMAHVAEADRLALSPRRALVDLDAARAVASRLGLALELRGFDAPDPLDPSTVDQPVWTFDAETSRSLRQGLVRRRELGADLRVRGSASHPEAPGLLRDCVRLFEHVDATLTGSMAHWSNADLRQLRGLASLVVPDELERVVAENPSLTVRLP